MNNKVKQSQQNVKYYDLSEISAQNDKQLIETISRRWVVDNEKPYDTKPMPISVEVLMDYRDVDRNIQRREAVLTLKKSIDEKGFQKSGWVVLIVTRDGCIFIGEGNHRIAAAHELGIEKIPAAIVLYSDRGGRSAPCGSHGVDEDFPGSLIAKLNAAKAERIKDVVLLSDPDEDKLEDDLEDYSLDSLLKKQKAKQRARMLYDLLNDSD